MRQFKKVLAIVLAVIMLAGVTVSAETVVTGTNGNTIELSLSFTSDYEKETAITSVSSGELFYCWVNFSGNPTTLEDSIQAYTILIGYDTTKMNLDREYVLCNEELTTSVKLNPVYTTGVAAATWTDTDGIYTGRYKTIVEEGCLFGMEIEALADLSKEDLNALTFLVSAQGNQDEPLPFKFVDGKDGYFTVTTPDPEPEKPTIAGSTSDSGATVTVTSSEDLSTLGTGLTVFVGVYNSNHELVDAKFDAYDKNGNEFLVDKTDASYYRAFVWDAKQTPVVDSVKF